MPRLPLAIRARRGFTAVELMIVMVAMLVLAGIVIPQFDSVIEEAAESQMLASLHDMHVAIERYRMDHLGQLPSSEAQLVSGTDRQGNVGQGGAYRFGPYLPEVPLNTINNVATITFVADSNPDPAQAQGWLLSTTTGQVWGGTKR